MRQTVTNMIGNLPPQFFAVTVTTVRIRYTILLLFLHSKSPVYKLRYNYSLVQVAENLAQLMYSVMMTGYMFKNAQNRLELQQSLEQVALPEPNHQRVF